MYTGNIYIEILTDELMFALNVNFCFTGKILLKTSTFFRMAFNNECIEGCHQK
jgi:hypothetical protein